MRVKDFNQCWRIGAAFAFACNIQCRIHAAQAVKEDDILCECDNQYGWSDGFTFDTFWRPLAIPALIKLSQAVDDIFIKAKPFSETLGHLAVTRKHWLHM